MVGDRIIINFVAAFLYCLSVNRTIPGSPTLLLHTKKNRDMKKISSLLAFLFLLSSYFVVAQDLTVKIPVSDKVKIGTLPNGLKYYIRYNAKPEHKVELRLAVNAGSILEDDDQQGLAHFMEHMNFNGLKHFPGNELVHYLQSIGVGFGNDLNAFTGFDQTVYILPVPTDEAKKIDDGFTVLADWAHGALLTGEEIDKERGVILSESRLGKGAEDRMMKIWLPLMLNGSKYGQRLPIGKDSILEKFDHSAIRKFYTDWYRPGLQAVIVVGDMPVDKAEQMIREKFGDYKDPANPRPRQELFEVKPFTRSQAVVVSDPEADMTAINLIGSSHVKKPSVTGADYLSDLIENLAGKMLSARLAELVSSANPPFIYAYTYLGSWARGYKNFTAVAMCSPEGIKTAVQTLTTECLRAKKFGYTEQELKRAKAALLSELEAQYNERDKTESGRLVWEYISNYLNKEPIPGIEWEYNFAKNHLDKIQLSDFDAIRKQIDIDMKYFSYVTTKTRPDLPKNDEYKAWIEEAMKATVTPYTEKAIANSLLKSEPRPGSIVSTTKDEKMGTVTWTLSNGATVCLKPTDFKNDEILFKGSKFGGYSTYTGPRYQSAQFCNNVTEEMGYGDFAKTDLEKFLSGKKVMVTPTVDDYTEFIEGNSSVKDLETMFQLIYLKSTSPRKDAEAFTSFITRSKQELALAKQNPESLFADTVFNTLYQGNPRAHQVPVPSDFDKINLDSAVAFYLKRIGNPSGMYYTFVGTFTEEQIRPLVEKYLAGIPAGTSKAGYKSMGMNIKPGNNTFTLRKGSEQKAMLLHYFSKNISFDIEDVFKLSQLNGIINIRVVDTIREKMSAIYGGGCGGTIKKYPKEELFVQSYFPCSPDNIAKVDEAFMRLIAQTRIPGNITDEDWKRVREPAIEKYRVDIKRNQYWLTYLQTSYLNGTDPARILTVEQRLNAITPAQLTAIANKLYTDDNIFKGFWLPEK